MKHYIVPLCIATPLFLWILVVWGLGAVIPIARWPASLWRKRHLLNRRLRLFPVFGMAIGAVIAGLMVLPTEANAVVFFRILEVRAEYGQLVVEAQHFNDDGTHWFYENYTFQGREQFNHPVLTDDLGRLFLKSSGMEAPKRLNNMGDELKYYLPEGEEWLRTNEPSLTQDSILSVIQSIHDRRIVSGWTKGSQRLTTHAMDAIAEDRGGADLLVQRFSDMATRAYIADHTNPLRAYVNPLPDIDPHISTAWGTVSTFYSDDPGPTVVDGQAFHSVGPGATWATIRGGAGTGNDDSSADADIYVKADTSTNNWEAIYRFFALFNTDAIADADNIDSATFEFVGISGAFTNDFSDSISMITTTPASNTALVNADYSQTGTTKQATDLTLAGLTMDSSTYNVFTLNSTGEGNINKTGVTKFGIRFTSDNDDDEPTWVSNKRSRIGIATAEETLAGDRRPKLVVTHSTPSAAITGTVGDGATEQEVRDGAGTIIITLTDTTWVAAGGTFDGERQNIINGLDAAESEATGWNAEVRDKIGVSSVVRTNSTIATVTLTASEVAGYRITSDETITVTVPASAIAAGGGVTATPTFTITAATEGVALTGTLQAGVAASTIVGGGKTLILTLTDTTWVASGATFNAQRQGIIDGVTSGNADQNGWENQKANLPVGDVIRTNATVVTVTLSALSGYAIPEPETLTATAPAAAIVYGATLTAAATATITPAFVASGTWVSPAMDLSGISSLSYCAVGWSATTPANTSVSGEYSTNGGSNYSAATNGSCPFTTGSDQSSVSDFRIKLSLSATSSTDTPTVEAVGFVAGDASGQTLRYQLNDTPALTVTDRSGGGYTGTMSFPSQPTGVTTTVGSMRAIREPVSAQVAPGVPQMTSPVTGTAVSTNIFNLDETGWSAMPFYDVANSMATAGDGLPIKFIWYILLSLVIVMMGFFALNLTSSLMAAAIAMGLGIGASAAIGGGLMPGWVIFVFLPIAGGLLLLRPRLPV